MERDPWRILGVTPRATLEEIKRAFREKVRLLHPDRQGGGVRTVEDFLKIKAAYQEILSHYSVTKETLVLENEEAPSGGSFSDGAYLFLEVPAEKAFYGGTVDVTLADEEEFCPRCEGVGTVSGEGESVCLSCSGTGYLKVKWGDECLQVLCTRCGGTGATGRPPCPLCKGMGRISRLRHVQIKLPRGIKSGTIIRLSGQGPWRPDRKFRDPLYVEIRVALPLSFSLLGNDLLSTEDIDIWTALVGGEIMVKTIEGRVPCTIPPGVQQGHVVRLKGHGWIDEAGNRGDHIVRFNILLPKGEPPPIVMSLIRLLRLFWPVGESIRALPEGGSATGRERS